MNIEIISGKEERSVYTKSIKVARFTKFEKKNVCSL